MNLRLLAILALCGLATPALAADLVVSVTGITQSTGSIRVVIILDPDGIARQGESRNLDAAQARNGVLTTKFKGLSPAKFGIVAVEEKTVNHALERAFTGHVAAPVASSNEVRVELAEPSTAVVVPLKPAQ